MAAKFCDHDVIDGDADIVDPGTSAARNLSRGSHQAVAELAGFDEADVALRGDSALIMGVAGKRKGRIRQQKNKSAMRDPLSVDHVRLDRHRQSRLSGFDLCDLHAETFAGV